jgi:hypothetical protein
MCTKQKQTMTREGASATLQSYNFTLFILIHIEFFARYSLLSTPHFQMNIDNYKETTSSKGINGSKLKRYS